MNSLQQEWEEKLRDYDHGADELEDTDGPFQQPLDGSETSDDLADRVTARDEKRESTRKRNLANAQIVIQHRYEMHGLTEVFLQNWLLKYLVFLQIRKNTDRSTVTIANALEYLPQESQEDHEYIIGFWLYLCNPTTRTPGSKYQGIRGFVDRIGPNGKPVPIHNWINRVFAEDCKREAIERQTENYRLSPIENDLSKRAGSEMSVDYAWRNAAPDWEINTSNTAREERDNWVPEIRQDALKFIHKWGWHKATPTKVIVTQTIIRVVPEMNAAKITRLMKSGAYPVWSDLEKNAPRPLPKTNVKTVERIVKALKAALVLHFRSKMIRTPRSNPRGFELRPPLTFAQHMSINRSQRDSSKAINPLLDLDPKIACESKSK